MARLAGLSAMAIRIAALAVALHQTFGRQITIPPCTGATGASPILDFDRKILLA
jgi:hypothetical protein